MTSFGATKIETVLDCEQFFLVVFLLYIKNISGIFQRERAKYNVFLVGLSCVIWPQFDYTWAVHTRAFRGFACSFHA